MAAPEPLQPGELIDDEALRDASDDAFRLSDFVSELTSVCERASPPVNVGLFGAWGSGKSSLANLLEQRLNSAGYETIVFARFDAFKYAGIALRRHLLSQLAESLGADANTYGEGLYKSKNTNSYEIPRRDALLRFVGLFLLALFAVGVLLLGSAAVVGLASDTGKHGAFGPAFRGTLRSGVPALLFASGLVGTLLTIAGKTFTVESTQAPPSTDEEFGRLFARLVSEVRNKTGCERIVVLVDELDRCSPGQVVAVLETIKTFLHIEPCVFVVAADRQAIEQAIGEEARQATPQDSVNPYYSAGGSYLDKIFQHQMTLPPLMPRTLSRFTLELIDERPGVWRTIANKAELVTVLVPEHVRSPRRVKVLLNAFLATYRLALMRAADGALDPDVGLRSSELAKLVCLQTEFPLFAAELAVDTRMVAATLALHDDRDRTLDDLKMPGFSEESFRRAAAYAAGRLPSDVVISHRQGAAGVVSRGDLEERGGSPTEPEETDAPVVDAADPEAHDEEDLDSIIESQSRQLGAYLARTRKITGPSRDLVVLESSGAAFELPAEIADRLERTARNGLTRAVTSAIGELAPAERPKVILLLCALAKDSIGLEQENACHCLLAALDAVDEGLEGVADEVLAALQAASDYDLRASDLRGALAVSLLRESPAAIELREQVLVREEARDDEELGLLALSSSAQLGDRGHEELGPILAARLLQSEPERVFAALGNMPDGQLVAMIAGERAAMLSSLGELEDEDAATIALALVQAGRGTRAAAAAALLELLLALRTTEARNAAEPLLVELAPIDDEQLIIEVLVATAHRRLRTWGQWLGSLDRDAVSEAKDSASSLAALPAVVLRQRFSDTSPTAGGDATSAIALLAVLASTQETLDPEPLREAFGEQAEAAALDPASAADRHSVYELLVEMAAEGLLAGRDAAKLIIDDLTRSIQSGLGIDESTPKLAAQMLAGANLALPLADAEQSAVLVQAVGASGWISGPAANAIVLHASARQSLLGEEVELPLSSDELAEIPKLGSASDAPLAAWLRAERPSPRRAYEILRTSRDTRGRVTEFMQALGALAGEWRTAQREAFDRLVAEGYYNGNGGLGLIAATRNGAPPEKFTVKLLGELSKRAANNGLRQRVLSLWVEFAPTSPAAIRPLITTVYEPLLSNSNKGSVRIALDHFALVAQPPSKTIRNRLRGKLKQAVRGDKAVRRRAEHLMLEAGWVRRDRLGRIRDS